MLDKVKSESTHQGVAIPNRMALIASWIVGVVTIALMISVHEGFFVLLLALQLIRPDLLDGGYAGEFFNRRPWLVRSSAAYAIIASFAILLFTLNEDKYFAMSLGVGALIVVFWPFLILFALNEREMFIGTRLEVQNVKEP